MIAKLKCTACGAEFPAGTLMNLCPVDQRPVEIIMDLERLQSEQPGLGWYRITGEISAGIEALVVIFQLRQAKSPVSRSMLGSLHGNPHAFRARVSAK